MKITVTINRQIEVPDGTVNIGSDKGWVTLARNIKGIKYIYTCRASQVGTVNFMDENIWLQFTDNELSKAEAL